uniref:Large ribosomal subunit protein bL20c n=1 Tax=Astrosyne radiata TaxID=1158023 RepID=A0A2U9NTW3_9STRA|nr:ribosomal protein L20 [Astrosyne radiata]YP_009497686.1 ribosomal protein L20 [Astrosyne radiata]AWT40326.1 ribosomal protein L20 [Astrosyne radiata]AWT40399.1 ribosomal protein L20 [Astrosyne radiata]
MGRTKRSNVRRKRVKRMLVQASGSEGSQSKLFRTAKQAVLKGLKSVYIRRKKKKKFFKKIWISRLKAIANIYGLSYAGLLNKLKLSKIKINKKILSHILILEPNVITEIFNKIDII